MKIKNVGTKRVEIGDLNVNPGIIGVVLSPGAELVLFDEDAEKSAALKSAMDAGIITKIGDEEPIENDIDVAALAAASHTQNTDQYLDFGGPSQVAAADVKTAVTDMHVQGTDQGLDTGGPNEVAVADIKTAVTDAHVQGTDLGLDTGGTNPVTAADIKTALDTTIPAKLDSASLVAYDSAASVGGAAQESLTVTGLAALDTILAVSQKTKGANGTAIVQWSGQALDTLVIDWTADPGAGAIVTVLVKKA